jgi:hypothetical protein
MAARLDDVGDLWADLGRRRRSLRRAQARLEAARMGGRTRQEMPPRGVARRQ